MMKAEKRHLAIAMQVLIVLAAGMPLALYWLRAGQLTLALELTFITAFAVCVHMWKQNFPRDWKPVAMLFAGIFAIAVAAAGISVSGPLIFPGSTGFAAIAGAAVFFLILARKFIMRGHTTGKVLLSNGKLAAVETEFDILSGTAKGRFVVEEGKAHKEGAEVKISVKNALFGKRPERIID